MKIKYLNIPSWMVLVPLHSPAGRKMLDSEFRLYLLIRNQARISGYCHTSEKVMALMLGRSQRHIVRLLKHLKTDGWIRVESEINSVNKVYVERVGDEANQKRVFRWLRGLRRRGGGDTHVTPPSGDTGVTPPPP